LIVDALLFSLVIFDELVKIICTLITLETWKNSSLNGKLFIKLPPLSLCFFDLLLLVLIQLMILFSILLVWPFEIDETLEWKLSFAVSAFSVSIMPQAANVHILLAVFIWTHCNLMIRIENYFTHTIRLQLRY